MFGDPVMNPMGWTEKLLKDVTDLIADCPHSTPVWTEKGRICLRTSNLTVGGWNWSDTRFVSEESFALRIKRAQIIPGDIILSREGTIGVAAKVEPGMDLCMGQRLVQVRSKDKIVHPEYLLHLLLWSLSPSRINRFLVGSTSQHLNVGDLRTMT